MTRTLAAALAAVALAAGPAAAQLRTPLETLRSSAEVLDEFRDLYLKRIPPALLVERLQVYWGIVRA